MVLLRRLPAAAGNGSAPHAKPPASLEDDVCNPGCPVHDSSRIGALFESVALVFLCCAVVCSPDIACRLQHIAISPSPIPYLEPTEQPAMRDAHVDQAALLKILLHATKHPSSGVNGVLLGTLQAASGGGAAPATVRVTDAIPVCHGFITLTPVLETALSQVGASPCIHGYVQCTQMALPCSAC